MIICSRLFSLWIIHLKDNEQKNTWYMFCQFVLICNTRNFIQWVNPSNWSWLSYALIPLLISRMCVVEKCHRQMHMFELRAPLGISGHLEYNFKNYIKSYIFSLTRNAFAPYQLQKISQIMIYNFYVHVKPDWKYKIVVNLI